MEGGRVCVREIVIGWWFGVWGGDGRVGFVGRGVVDGAGGVDAASGVDVRVQAAGAVWVEDGGFGVGAVNHVVVFLCRNLVRRFCHTLPW